MAGIAVVEVKPNPRLVAVEVMEAPSSIFAEGLAVLRATAFATSFPIEERGAVWTDSRQLVTAVYGGTVGKPYVRELAKELKVALGRRSLILEDRPRMDVSNAHRAARAVLKAWKAGQSGEATWERPVYLQPGR